MDDYLESQLTDPLRKVLMSLTLMIVTILVIACGSQRIPNTVRTPTAAATVRPTDDLRPMQTEAARLATEAAARAAEVAAQRATDVTGTQTALAPTATRAPATATPSPTRPPTITARVTTDILNVRSGPGTNYPRQMEVRQGMLLIVVECSADRNWIHVRTSDGKDGWVATEYTDLGTVIAKVPLAINIPPTPKVVAQPGMIAFKSDRGGIWIMNPDGSNQQPLPDPSIYYYALREGGPEYCSRNGLYCVKADSDDGWNMDIFVEDREHHTGWHKIVSNDHLDWDPRIHPDGWWVVFVTNRNGNDELYLINRQAREERRLTVNDWEWDKHPTWSPDGRLIAFFSNRITGRRQIWVLDPSAPFVPNANPRNISNNPYVDYEPVWLK
jgi:uncharacterized protein YraI